MNIHENDLQACINQLIEVKKSVKDSSGRPIVLKKKELEDYLEQCADQHSISYEKKPTAMRTIYSFIYNQGTVSLEIYYRYTNFYTRHHFKEE